MSSTVRIIWMLIGLAAFGVMILSTLPGVQSGDKGAQSMLVVWGAFAVFILIGLGAELYKRFS